MATMDQVNKYEYIEMVAYDVHSIPRGRLVANRRFISVIEKGLGMYNGILYFGVKDQPNICDYFAANRNYGNAYLVPILDTLVDAPKSACGDKKVGQVMCDFRLADGTLEPSTPRYVAQRQVERLTTMGLCIKSSVEAEFGIVDAHGKGWGHSDLYGNMNIISNTQDVFMELMDELAKCNVYADCVQTECGMGQFELNLDVVRDMEGPDMTARFKSLSKVFFHKRDLTATFMTKIGYESFCQGFHFNHSLWNREDKNVFLDENSPGQLSRLGKQWLAGLITHAPALTAILCPTVNCYRRLHHILAPCKANWGVNDRLATYRLVSEMGNNVYLEARMPSSASNPYLAMAGIIAAGMDGIHRQLSLDDVNQDIELPRDLETALKTLEDDAVLVESLGKDFVDCFTYVKRTFEIDHFKSLGEKSDEDMFEEEKKFYFPQL